MLVEDSLLQTTLTTAVMLLLITVGLVPTPTQKKQRIETGDDPHGLKVVGMPKANRKYLIAELPSHAETPAEYKHCGSGVYYVKERVRGVNITAVMVYFRAEGDFEFTDDVPDVFKPANSFSFESHVPPGWVSLTFTLLPDSFTLQEIRLIRGFPPRPTPGTMLQWNSGLIAADVVRVDRSWVDKDPYVTWEILPESQLSHLVFRIRLPKSTKDCLQSK